MLLGIFGTVFVNPFTKFEENNNFRGNYNYNSYKIVFTEEDAEATFFINYKMCYKCILLSIKDSFVLNLNDYIIISANSDSF